MTQYSVSHTEVCLKTFVPTTDGHVYSMSWYVFLKRSKLQNNSHHIVFHLADLFLFLQSTYKCEQPKWLLRGQEPEFLITGLLKAAHSSALLHQSCSIRSSCVFLSILHLPRNTITKETKGRKQSSNLKKNRCVLCKWELGEFLHRLYL